MCSIACVLLQWAADRQAKITAEADAAAAREAATAAAQARTEAEVRATAAKAAARADVESMRAASQSEGLASRMAAEAAAALKLAQVSSLFLRTPTACLPYLRRLLCLCTQ